MNHKVAAVLTILSVSSAFGAGPTTTKFDDMKVAQAPPRWLSGFLGEKGSPHWVVADDPSAVSPPHVLKQDGNAPCAWIVHPDLKLKDGRVEAQFKIEGGKEDPEAGVIWRFQNPRNYYYVRANSTENNVIFYRMVEGRKEEVKTIEVPVALGRWHRFKITFRGESIGIIYDGKEVIALNDGKFKQAGGVGLFSMADTVSAFDDFSAE